MGCRIISFMKITPLEIRQKSFEKNFRGYDKDEVSSFLVSLSQEWEKIMDEKKELQMKLEQAQKESAKLRDVEDSLFRTLRAAEDTGANMIEQANKTAELILKEAQMNADAMISEAKNKSRNIIDSAENKAKGIMEDLKEDVNTLVDNYEHLVTQREMITRNLKSLANDTMETLKHSQEELKRVDIEAHTKLVKELSRQESYLFQENAPQPKEEAGPKATTPMVEVKESPVTDTEGQEQVKEEEVRTESQTSGQQTEDDLPGASEETRKEEEEKPKKNQSGSFFDQFD